MHRALLLAAVFSLAPLAGCGTSYAPVSSAADAHLIAEAHSPAEVRAAVIRALKAQRFITEAEVPGAVRARFERGDEMFRVKVEYSATQFAIHYENSRGMETFPDAGGGTIIEDRYHKLVAKFAKAVDLELRRPAEQAAQAAAEERQYQLLLEQARAGTLPGQTSQPGQPGQPAQPAPGPGGMITIPLPPLPGIPTGGGGGTAVEQKTTIKRSDSELTCTINGSSYACPNQEEFSRCVRMEGHGCKPK